MPDICKIWKLMDEKSFLYYKLFSISRLEGPERRRSCKYKDTAPFRTSAVTYIPNGYEHYPNLN